MLRKLLADRLQLRLQTEKRELAVYALVVDKGGPKLRLRRWRASIRNMACRGLARRRR
jgi:uncharacterized protein (TIGR03435 family)